VYDLQRLNAGHLPAVLAFELENRAYFARSITDPGDAFYDSFPDHHRALLAEQETGASVYSVLVDGDGSVLGRFNLRDIDAGVARLGYRVAERSTGQGVATSAVRELCRRAAAEYGLTTLTAETSDANLASRRVLEKLGFTSTGSCVVGGKPGRGFILALPGAPR
jgi:[ribosomal protein S5]-alanine N-acetyltransferase